MQDNNEKAVIQNLKDAGCDDKTISDFMERLRKRNRKEVFKLLAQHRQCLLDLVHDGQKCIDCLDYLIYQMQKKDKN